VDFLVLNKDKMKYGLLLNTTPGYTAINPEKNIKAVSANKQNGSKNYCMNL